jgi:YjbE family integral membrane protein
LIRDAAAETAACHGARPREEIVTAITLPFTFDAWSDLLRASVDNFGHSAFWVAVLQIIVINVVLSGDNAVVIAMACRALPPRQRFWGMLIGAGVAVTLLIVFTGIVARLLRFPYLKLVGGIALLYVGAKLLVPENTEDETIEAAAHLSRAVRVIVVADVIMSLDNIIAVAATARGNILLLAIGLAVSIPIIIAGAALIMALLDRFAILVWSGAALLGWVAGSVIASDPVVVDLVTGALGKKTVAQVDVAAAGAGALLVIAAGGLWRHWQIIGSGHSTSQPGGT